MNLGFQTFLIIILLNASLFFGCRNHRKDSNGKADYSKTIPSTELSHADDTVKIIRGKTLFKTNCGACHAIGKTDNYLEGIVERLGENYLKLYLTKQDSLIKAKDKIALEIKERFGNLGNSHNFNFSNEELDAIIAYLKKYSS